MCLQQISCCMVAFLSKILYESRLRVVDNIGCDQLKPLYAKMQAKPYIPLLYCC